MSVPVELDLPEVFLPTLPPSPYPGLRPFEKSEWPIFFGRERMTDRVVEQLSERQLVVVHGASGCGKSSLVRAGILSRLEQEYSRYGSRWLTGAMRPGNAPLANLTDALIDALGGRLSKSRTEIRRALNHGRKAPQTLSGLLGLSQSDRVCILIDQFEELFRFAGEGNREESSLLTDFLVGFHQNPVKELSVIVTMRSDFLGECARFDGLAETINHSQYLLPAMETNDLLRAVRDPAALYGSGVTERLAERLIADAREGEDELPLIQHGLSRLWRFTSPASEFKGRRWLDLSDYEGRGPLARLLSDHADTVADTIAGDPARQKIIEEVFRALTDISADGKVVRRSQTFGHLATVAGTTQECLGTLLDAFRQPGISFITPYPPAHLASETTIDISHEALIRRWRKIADPRHGWLQREFRDGLIWRSLLVQAESFSADPKNLLSEATTEARRVWIEGRNEAWALRYGGRWDLVRELIGASRREVEHRRQLAEEERQRAEELRIEQTRRKTAERLSEEQRKRAEAEAARAASERNLADRRRKQVWTIAFVAVIAASAAGLAIWLWHEASRTRDQANVQAQAAQFTAEKEAREREKAEIALSAERDANTKLQTALDRAARTQSSSAEVVAGTFSSGESDTVAFSRILLSLGKTRDPYQVAVLGQSIAALGITLSITQAREVMTILTRRLEETGDASAASAIAQAMRTIAESLKPEQAQAALGPVLQGVQRANNPDQLVALATVAQTIAHALPKLNAGQVAVEIANALIRVANGATPEQADSALDVVFDAMNTTPNHDQLRLLVKVVEALAPNLSQDQAQSALDRMPSGNPATAAILRPAQDALMARTAIAQNYLICIGDGVSRVGRCPPESIILPCGSSIEEWAKTNQCLSFQIKKLADSEGGRCGYFVAQVSCTKYRKTSAPDKKTR